MNVVDWGTHLTFKKWFLNMTSTKSTNRTSNMALSAGSGVQIDVYHGTSLLDPAPGYSILKDVVGYTNKTFELTDKGKIVERLDRVVLHGLDHRDRPAIPTGLVPAVADRLREAGIEAMVNDRREFGPAHEISKKVLTSSKGDDRRLLKALKQHPLGQIEVRSTLDMLNYMHMICQLFPDAHVLIPVAQKKDAWSLWRQLNERVCGFHVQLKTGRWPRKRPRCLVTAYPSCIPNYWDIILLPNPLRASQNRLSHAMGLFRGSPHRCYSFVRPGQRFGRRDRIRLEAMSGRMIYETEPGRLAIEVLWLQPPQSPPSGCERRSLDWKKAAYWHNVRRNEYIADVARAFAEVNKEELRTYGVRFRADKPLFTNSEAPEVVVLVESIEHGRGLLKHLDGWMLFDRAAGERSNTAEAIPRGKIITAVRAAADGFEADVVLQAAGGAGTGVFQNIVGETTAYAGQMPALIVDFADSYDDLAALDARKRTQGYERLGWKQSKFPSKSSTKRRKRVTPRHAEVSK